MCVKGGGAGEVDVELGRWIVGFEDAGVNVMV